MASGRAGSGAPEPKKAPNRSGATTGYEAELWRMADTLRGSMDAAEYKHVANVYLNWCNYNLVVIDESHNFRNKRTPRQGGETRYDRLMRRIIREGVRTRVLKLSDTPVNNRLAVLRNKIVFATEGDDTALVDGGISSIAGAARFAQKQLNGWLEMEDCGSG